MPATLEKILEASTHVPDGERRSLYVFASHGPDFYDIPARKFVAMFPAPVRVPELLVFLGERIWVLYLMRESPGGLQALYIHHYSGGLALIPEQVRDQAFLLVLAKSAYSMFVGRTVTDYGRPHGATGPKRSLELPQPFDALTEVELNAWKYVALYVWKLARPEDARLRIAQR